MPSPADEHPTPDARTGAALWFAGHGFGIFPVWSTLNGRCRCPDNSRTRTDDVCSQAGKHPMTVHGFKDATTDPKRIRTFLSAPSEPNYGMVPPEGVFIWDVDTDEERARLASLETRYGPLPATLRDDTANGQHLFLRWPEGFPRPVHKMFGLVTRWGSGAAEGYVVGPLSVHVSGSVYRSTPGTTGDIATLPEAWARAAVEGDPGTITFKPGSDDPAAVPVGGRHDWLRNTARRYAGVVRDPDALLAAVWAENEKLPVPKSREEVQRAIGDVLVKFPADPEKAQETIRRTSEAGRVDAADLLGLDLPPLRMVIPGILPEGTTVLASPPKVGKSCLVYQMAVEVAIGGSLFDERVVPGSVLYLALEDGQRRGQARLRAALDGRTMPRGRLEVQWAAPNIGAGLEESIEAWLDAHQDAALVAVDTLQKVRKGSAAGRNAYEVDVEDLGRLQSLFRDRSVALLIVHHSRKEAGDDFLASVSGTYGITGSADTIIVIRRKRLEAYGTIVATGREIAEAEISVRFDDMTWTQAPASIAEASFERMEVYRTIQESGPLFPAAIATRLGLVRQSVQAMVGKLEAAGAVYRTTHGYMAHNPLMSPPVSDVSQSNQSNGGETPMRAPTREAHPGIDCRDYRAHQSRHRRTPDGFVCDACDETPA